VTLKILKKCSPKMKTFYKNEFVGWYQWYIISFNNSMLNSFSGNRKWCRNENEGTGNVIGKFILGTCHYLLIKFISRVSSRNPSFFSPAIILHTLYIGTPIGDAQYRRKFYEITRRYWALSAILALSAISFYQRNSISKTWKK
jgi:hypothetical protein